MKKISTAAEQQSRFFSHVRGNAAQLNCAGDGDAFAVGEPAAERVGA